MKQFFVYKESDLSILTESGFAISDMRNAKFMYFSEATAYVKANPGTQWDSWGPL